MRGILSIPESFLKKQGVKNPEPIIYAGVIVVGIIAFILVKRQVMKLFGGLTVAVDKHTVVGRPTITKDDAKSIADRIWDLLNSNFFVSFKSIKQLFDAYSLNSADKAMIYNAFGIRNSGFPTYVKGDMYFWFDRKIKIGVHDAKEYFGI